MTKETMPGRAKPIEESLLFPDSSPFQRIGH